jgi:hypothetical protein
MVAGYRLSDVGRGYKYFIYLVLEFSPLFLVTLFFMDSVSSYRYLLYFNSRLIKIFYKPQRWTLQMPIFWN